MSLEASMIDSAGLAWLRHNKWNLWLHVTSFRSVKKTGRIEIVLIHSKYLVNTHRLQITLNRYTFNTMYTTVCWVTIQYCCMLIFVVQYFRISFQSGMIWHYIDVCIDVWNRLASISYFEEGLQLWIFVLECVYSRMESGN